MILKWFPLFIMLFSSISLADIYYAAPISKSCNPKNPGTGSLEDPFKHPHYALYHQKVGCGDTLILKGGTYQSRYKGFSKDTTLNERSLACDDDNVSGEKRDGKSYDITAFDQL